MQRPLWKGHLVFGLVTIPVRLYSAVNTAREVDLDLLDERDHSRVRYRRVSERTGREVPWKSIVKGFKSGGDYVVLDEKDFEAAGKRVARGVEILQFVKQEEIDTLAFERPYYLVPEKSGEKAYAILRETLRESGLVGIAMMVLQTKQHLAALMVVGDSLTLMTMRFAEELRSVKDLDVPTGAAGRAKASEVEVAKMLVKAMTKEWKPEEFRNEYRHSLMRIIRKKAESGGKAPVEEAEEEERATEPSSLMEMLRRSVEEAGSRSGGRRRSRGGRHVQKARTARARRPRHKAS